jgi:hypothetical protein
MRIGVNHGHESGDQLRFMGNADLCGNQVGGVGRIAFLMQTLDQQVGDPSGAIHLDLWQSSQILYSCCGVSLDCRVDYVTANSISY